MCHIFVHAQSFAYSQKMAVRVGCDHENNSVRSIYIKAIYSEKRMDMVSFVV